MDIVRHKMRPCILTQPAQGDDYGVDAYVEHVIGKSGLVQTGRQFAIQSKGTLTPFEATPWPESTKVRDLIKWERATLEVLFVATSVDVNESRWRFVRDVITELDRTIPSWRDRNLDSTVTIKFAATDRHLDDLHKWIDERLNTLTDQFGGKDRVHRAVRSVLVTELYHRYAFSGNRGQLAAGSPKGPVAGNFISGMQWLDGEFDVKSLAAIRVLSGALLMFEEVFFPASMAYSVVDALGPILFLKLIHSGRLIPVQIDKLDLAFVSGSSEPQFGDLYYLEIDTDAIQNRHLESLRVKYKQSKSFVRSIENATRHIQLPSAVNQELLDISKRQEIRELLGLGLPRPQSREGVWSAERLLRIGHVLNFYVTAKRLNADVVELEPGLAKIALARWSSRIDFHRIYEVLDIIEAALATSALPDLGVLSKKIGLQKCIEISNSEEGEKFRNWFWENASSVLASRGEFDSEFVAKIRTLAHTEETLPKEFLVASSEIGDNENEGWASRPGANESLHRQKIGGETRLRRALRDYRIQLPAMNDPCICESDTNFESCCGRVTWQTNQDVIDMFYNGQPPPLAK